MFNPLLAPTAQLTALTTKPQLELEGLIPKPQPKPIKPLTSPPESKPNYRPKLVSDLTEVILTEYLCTRTRDSRLGDRYENFKAKLRYRFTKDELRELAQLSAAAVVEANHLCTVSAKRMPLPGANIHPRFKDRTR